MNIEIIDKAFAELISRRGIHNKLGISQTQVGVYRYNLKNGIPISLDRKLGLLEKAGFKQNPHCYTSVEMIQFAKDWAKAPAATKELGPEYFLEKWKIKKGL